MIRVDLGEVAIEEDIDDSQLEQIRIALQRFGLELMEDKRTILVESIKNLVIEIVYSPDLAQKATFLLILLESFIIIIPTSPTFFPR